MKRNYTHIVLLVDKSWSMTGTRASAQAGINEFLQTNLNLDGQKVTVTVTEFSDRSNTIERLSRQAVEYYLQPGGNTALYDAIGFEIERTERDIASLPTRQRPNQVLFAIVTDGGENASQTFNQYTAKSKIASATRAGWEFVFIGAGLHAWQGQNLGIRHNFTYDDSVIGTERTWRSVSNLASNYAGSSVIASSGLQSINNA